MSLACVILAAGQGTRMKSELPKVLHPLAGRPMVHYPLQAAAPLGPEPVVVVIDPEGEAIRRALGQGCRYALQTEPLGTGHALLQAREAVGQRADPILVLYGADPLFTTETLQRLVEAHRSEGAVMTLTTAVFPEPPPYGRVLRDEQGKIVGLVEEWETSPEQRDIREVACGALCFSADWLWPALERLEPSPAKGEIYLTGLAALAVDEGAPLATFVLPDWREGLGVNDRADLARVQAVLWERIRARHQTAGVTLLDPQSIYIDDSVRIGQDTVVYPGSYLEGDTEIGRGCRIGPQTVVRSSRVGPGCVLEASWLEEAQLDHDVRVGPFSHLRPGARVGAHSSLGNYAEVKNSVLGERVHVGHFSYIGDAEVGEGVNIGAGTITCNYDGVRKNRTVIERGAFIGSDTLLVAPVRVGAEAVTGAGSVVTRDVPPGSTAVGVPARIIRRQREGRQQRGEEKSQEERQSQGKQGGR